MFKKGVDNYFFAIPNQNTSDGKKLSVSFTIKKFEEIYDPGYTK